MSFSKFLRTSILEHLQTAASVVFFADVTGGSPRSLGLKGRVSYFS